MGLNRHALIAQWIEHLTTDQKVGGSSPFERAEAPHWSTRSRCGVFAACLEFRHREFQTGKPSRFAVAPVPPMYRAVNPKSRRLEKPPPESSPSATNLSVP